MGVGAVILVGGKLARAGSVDLMHYSTQGGIEKQSVMVIDNGADGIYMDPFMSSALIAYAKNSQGTKLMAKGIGPQKTSAVKVYLDYKTVPNGTPHSIRLDFLGSDMNDYAARNLTLRQDQNDPGADTSVYDILDLTNWGTQIDYIQLPPVTGANSVWIFRSDNYADIAPSVLDGNLSDGKVNWKDFAHFALYWRRNDCNENNHWCNYADLSRNGDVNEVDLGLLCEQWLYDSNDPNA
jgi:hypothetical protein